MLTTNITKRHSAANAHTYVGIICMCVRTRHRRPESLIRKPLGIYFALNIPRKTRPRNCIRIPYEYVGII